MLEALLWVAVLLFWFGPPLIATRDDRSGRRYTDSGCLFAISVAFSTTIGATANYILSRRRGHSDWIIYVMLFAGAAFHLGIFYVGSDSFRDWVHARWKRARRKRRG